VNARLARILRENSATSTAEYAVVIALIAAAIMLASDAVRLAADSSFRRAAVAMGVEPAAAPAGVGAAGAGDAPAEVPLISVAAIPPLHALAWGVLFTAAAIVGRNRYRQMRSRRAVTEIECTAEPVVEEPTNPNFEKRQEIQRILLRHFDGALHSRIEVRHIMSRKVRAVQPTTSVEDLQTVMESECFHHLLVMKGEALAGVISDRDVRSRSGRRASDIMTANPLTVSSTTHLNQAITAMLHRQISCVPVVDGGQVKGILTSTDVLMSLQCLMQLLERSHTAEEPAVAAPVSVPMSIGADAGSVAAAC
jgi:CBS domain-containing protein